MLQNPTKTNKKIRRILIPLARNASKYIRERIAQYGTSVMAGHSNPHKLALEYSLVMSSQTQKR
ncbi:MAG TPA: hypothetical protein VMW15_07770, partial [Terracidiphilus sp.]|nr:hypothetical protein [Terracidiphilus sp.]